MPTLDDAQWKDIWARHSAWIDRVSLKPPIFWSEHQTMIRELVEAALKARTITEDPLADMACSVVMSIRRMERELPIRQHVSDTHGLWQATCCDVVTAGKDLAALLPQEAS